MRSFVYQRQIFMYHNKLIHPSNGFTLIELMIVVAIIGVLAAVAIPGFNKYIRDSKQTEATGMLRSLSDGATLYYNTEHVFDTAGLVVIKDFFPGCEPAGATTPSPCSEVTNYTGTRVIAQRISPEDPALAKKEVPWNKLNVAINRPFFYILTYTSDPTHGSSSFEAHAIASLEADDDSELKIAGSCKDGQMTIGNIMILKDGSGSE